MPGVDAQRVRALDAAARASECEISLALADVHESWSAFEPDEPYGRKNYRYEEDDDDEEATGDSGAYELDELLDSSVSLSDWVDRSGTPAPPVATAVFDDEVCMTTPTRALAPYESEYEGYMRNYGNTMDRWYRRGAVVRWPTRLDFEVRAEASPQWALDALQALIRDGDLTRARERAQSLTSFWKDLRSEAAFGELVGRKPDLGQALAVADGLDDAGLAAMLLAPFRLEDLTPANSALLAALAQRQGERWTRTLLAGWRPERWQYAPSAGAGWLAALPELCGALRDANGLLTARLVLAVGWEDIAESIRQARGITRPSRRARALQQLAAPVAGLLVGAAISDAPTITAAVVAVFTDDATLRRCAVSALRTLPLDDPEVRAGSGFDALARNAMAGLESGIARPPRDPDDWSIEPPGGCACAVCVMLNDFLADPRLRVLDWPLKEQSRQHVHQQIDGHELPVRHVTRRAGRPYTLQLSKRPALFEREQQERQADEADLRWLREVVR